MRPISVIETLRACEATPEEQALISAREDFVVRAQFAVYQSMRQQGVSYDRLAELTGQSREAVKDFMEHEPENEPTLTLRLLAGYCHALGLKISIEPAETADISSAGA